MTKPMTILISGAPGTGTSTVLSHAPYIVRAQWGETAVLSVDAFYGMFDPRWMINHRGWWDLALANCLVVTANLFQQGVDVVVIEGNGLYATATVNAILRTVLVLSTVYHVTLDAHIDVVTRRIQARGDAAAHPPDWVARWLEHIRGHYAAWTQVIDTSTLTPEETLERIVYHINRGDGQLTELLVEAYCAR